LIIGNNYKQEFSLVLNEITLFKTSLTHPIDLKRLKASVERALRLAKTFTQTITETFQHNVLALGEAFKINRHSVEVFSESFIRSHVIFQLSKLCDGILGHIRQVLKLPPYIVIAPGSKNEAVGNIRECYHLSDLIHIESMLGAQKQKLLILLESADGTEEIPSCVSGILLKHDLP
jgi:hypothetical protein